MDKRQAFERPRIAGRFSPTWRIALVAFAPAVAIAIAAGGCTNSGQSSAKQAATVVAQSDVSEELFDNAVGMLNTLDEFEPDQNPLAQIVERLNQWMVTRRPQADWELDPMVADLPENHRKLRAVDWLDAMQFEESDAQALQEVVWLRNVARQVAGEELDALEQAKLLFDWTIRNIQIEPDVAAAGSPERMKQFPQETLLCGRGTAIDRAWVFILLCRQAELDAMMLALPKDGAEKELEPWLPAVLIDKRLYLFDTRLGLPLPGKDRQGVATLAEVAADDAILRQLDLSGSEKYPVTAARAAKSVALLEGSPLYLSRRGHLVESRLAGNETFVLSTSPTALARDLKEMGEIQSVKLWTLPYERIAERGKTSLAAVEAFKMPFMLPKPVLWKARVLHLMGLYTGEKTAIRWYLLSRPPEQEILAANVPFELKEMVRSNKTCATYWLALVSYEREEYPLVVDYLVERLPKLPMASSWFAGTRYNLGRAYEKLGQTDEAIKQYQSDRSPQRHGNQLRARWLREDAAKGAAPAAS